MICHCNIHSVSLPLFHFQAKLSPTDENLSFNSTFPSPPDLPLRRPVSDLHVCDNDHNGVKSNITLYIIIYIYYRVCILYNIHTL